MEAVSRRFTVFVVLCALGVLLGPRFLPMNDASSHIATAVIAKKLVLSDPFFAAHFHFQPVPLPYWATTLLLVVLGSVLPPLFAWKCLIGMYIVLWPVSLWALWRSVHNHTGDEQGIQPPLWPLCALTVFHFGYWMGESNYLLGQPMAFFALAAFVRLQTTQSLRFVGFLLLSCAVYLCHIYALTLVLIAAAAWSAVACSQRLPGARFRTAHVHGLLCLCGLFALATYFVLAAHGAKQHVGRLQFEPTLYRLAHMFVDPFDSPNPPQRVVLIGLYAGLLAVFAVGHRRTFLALLRRQQCTQALGKLVEPGLFFPGLVVLLAAFLGPVSVLTDDGQVKESEIAIRFVLGGFGLLAMSFKLPAAQSWNSGRGVLLALLCGFSCFQLSSVYGLHLRVGQQAEQIDQALLAEIPPHSRVLPLMHMPSAVFEDFLLHRFGNYVVLRQSYSPHVFAALGQQPLRHILSGDHRAVSNLSITNREWNDYDYVLLQTNEKLPRSFAPRLEWMRTQGGFSLWRVRK